MHETTTSNKTGQQDGCLQNEYVKWIVFNTQLQCNIPANIAACISAYTPIQVSPGHTCRTRMEKQVTQGRYIFNFVRYCQFAYQRVNQFNLSTSNVWQLSFLYILANPWLFSGTPKFSNMMSVKWFLVLIFMSLVVIKVEHLFVCLSILHSSSVNCLFIDFIQP